MAKIKTETCNEQVDFDYFCRVTNMPDSAATGKGNED
jgi:hypothetical protein